VLLDPSPAERMTPLLLRLASYVTPNEAEAHALTGIPVRSARDAEAAGAALVRAGAGTALVKLGAGGVVAVTRETTFHVPAFRVRPVDTTGAGDAFAGALAAALTEGRPLEDAVRFAAAAAALAVTRPGAQAALPDRQEVDGFLAARGALP